jgi:hypothetical protein
MVPLSSTRKPEPVAVWPCCGMPKIEPPETPVALGLVDVGDRPTSGVARGTARARGDRLADDLGVAAVADDARGQQECADHENEEPADDAGEEIRRAAAARGCA